MKQTKPPDEIEAYIARFPADVQAILRKLRQTIRKAAPAAQELISYQMPAFKQHGILVYFAAWKHHIGLYPPITGDKPLETAVAPYAGPKGAPPIPPRRAHPLRPHRPHRETAREARRRESRSDAKEVKVARQGTADPKERNSSVIESHHVLIPGPQRLLLASL